MKRPNSLLAGLLASLIAVPLACSIALAQPASQNDSSNPPAQISGNQGPMMGSMATRHMEGMRSMHEMGMGCMGGPSMMPMMMPMMRKDPKLMGRMIELRGEMMQTMGTAMIERGKAMQAGNSQHP